jgi:hypothetical protein
MTQYTKESNRFHPLHLRQHHNELIGRIYQVNLHVMQHTKESHHKHFYH